MLEAGRKFVALLVGIVFISFIFFINAHAATTSHTVQAGDTLWRIASTNGLKVSDLLQFNPQIKNKDMIYVGQEIRLQPQQTETEPEYTELDKLKEQFQKREMELLEQIAALQAEVNKLKGTDDICTVLNDSRSDFRIRLKDFTIILLKPINDEPLLFDTGTVTEYRTLGESHMEIRDRIGKWIRLTIDQNTG